MRSFHCNCRDHTTCLGYFVCLCFFIRSKYISNIACKRYWKKLYFLFRSDPNKAPVWSRKGVDVCNQYADLRFVVSLGSSRNTRPRGAWEVFSSFEKGHIGVTVCPALTLICYHFCRLAKNGNNTNALNNVKSFFDKVARIHGKSCKCVTNH